MFEFAHWTCGICWSGPVTHVCHTNIQVLAHPDIQFKPILFTIAIRLCHIVLCMVHWFLSWATAYTDMCDQWVTSILSMLTVLTDHPLSLWPPNLRHMHVGSAKHCLPSLSNWWPCTTMVALLTFVFECKSNIRKTPYSTQVNASKKHYCTQWPHLTNPIPLCLGHLL